MTKRDEMRLPLTVMTRPVDAQTPAVWAEDLNAQLGRTGPRDNKDRFRLPVQRTP